MLKAQVMLEKQPVKELKTILNSSQNIEESQIRSENQANPLANLTSKKFKIPTGQKAYHTLDDIYIPDMTQGRTKN